MNKIAVIGGSRFNILKNLRATHTTAVKTPYGEPSASLCYGILHDKEVVFIPRRGSQDPMPPHKINYRANIWALRDAGVKQIIATAAVGGITPRFVPKSLVIPSQLIDYTYGRENTFFGDDASISHVSFATPYNENLRQKIIQLADSKAINIPVIKEATYGITQGPRFETLAEIKRLERDGCDIVGMTGMPEAALARELELEYACIAIVIRQAAKQEVGDYSIDTSEQESMLEMLVEAIIQEI